MSAHDFMAFSVTYHRLANDEARVQVDAGPMGDATITAPNEPLAFQLATAVMCGIVASDEFEVPLPDAVSNDLNAMLKETTDERG